MLYHEQLNKHLIAYKRDVLGRLSQACIAIAGATMLLHHILPIDSSWLNLLGRRALVVQPAAGIQSVRTASLFPPSQFISEHSHSISFSPSSTRVSAAASALFVPLAERTTLLGWGSQSRFPIFIEGHKHRRASAWDTADDGRTICEVLSKRLRQRRLA